MPAAPRPKKKDQKMFEAILGKPENKQGKRTEHEIKIEQMIMAQQVRRSYY